MAATEKQLMQEEWAEQHAKMFEQRAKSIEELLPGWEGKRYADAYVQCLHIVLKAAAYRELASDLRRSKWLRQEQESYER